MVELGAMEELNLAGIELNMGGEFGIFSAFPVIPFLDSFPFPLSISNGP